jgi:hypothetical protein
MNVSEELKEKDKKLENSTQRNRALALGSIYKLMLLSASIVAFSVTLVSANALSAKVDFKILYYSWWMFLAVIIEGSLLLFFESRIEQAKAWRYYMQYKSPEREELSNISCRENAIIYWGLIRSLIFPENLFFDKIREDNQETKKDQIRSFMLLHNIARFRMFFIYGLENIFYISFIVALIIFIKSIRL